jgi:hypothetical protein
MQLTAASRIKFRGAPLATQLPQGQRSRSPQGNFNFIYYFFKRRNKQYRFQNTAANNIGFKTCNVCWNIFVGNFLFYWMVVGSNSITTFDNYRTVGAFLWGSTNFFQCATSTI